MTAIRCTQCDGTELDPGFIEDAGEHSKGYARWIPGPLKLGILGGAKRFGKDRWQIDAYRCRGCGHLEMFASVQAY
ncbi:hypothetical protein AB0L25_22130 [Spirillospora sp. NPDC052242]